MKARLSSLVLSCVVIAHVSVVALASSAAAPPSSSLRASIIEAFAKHPKGHNDPEIRKHVQSLLTEYASTDEADPADVVFTIGIDIYGAELPKKQTSGDEEDAAVILPFAYMEQFMVDVFVSYGVPSDRAKICAEVLVESDRRGIDSHGLGRLKPIYCDRMDANILYPDQPITILKETDCTALVDGNLGIGLYIGPYCMQLAIDKAKKHGVGFVVCQNSTHYGIAGYYATMASSRGCIGFTGTNARPSIAPTFGVEPMLGTNPLCFGIPSNDPFDFVIDCATSINQRGKIERYEREGLPTPRGCVIDEHGMERTDTSQILKDMVLGTCCLTPVGGAGDKMGGYKGYGWATTVELLCTAFQSGPFGEEVCGVDRATGKPKPMPLGHFFLAIDIEAICPLPVFKENVSKLLKALRDSKKSPTGPGRIWTAGEPERTCHRRGLRRVCFSCTSHRMSFLSCVPFQTTRDWPGRRRAAWRFLLACKRTCWRCERVGRV
jgi:L-2-hydroxycarboxylate dehydrogenase (NAD+)